MSGVLNKEDFLVKVDIEKAFDSVNHLFLIDTLEKIAFGTEFIEWIKVLLNNQESCVIIGGKTSKYFKLVDLSTLLTRMILPFFLKILNML